MPFTDQGLPFSGRDRDARHASWTGSQAAAATRAGKTQRYLELLQTHGPLSDHAVAALTGWGLSSVNSIRSGVEELVVAEGFDTAQFGTRTTRRTRWRLKTKEERHA